MADNKSCEGNKFNVGDLRTRLQFDTSDIVKQLKAIQREAKKATAALKELESTEAKVCSIYGVPAGLLKSDSDFEEQLEAIKKMCSGDFND